MKYQFIIIGVLVLAIGLISVPSFTSSAGCTTDSDCNNDGDGYACTSNICNAGTCVSDDSGCGCYSPTDSLKCNIILNPGSNDEAFIADPNCIIIEDNIQKACCTSPYCGGQYNYLPIEILI